MKISMATFFIVFLGLIFATEGMAGNVQSGKTTVAKPAAPIYQTPAVTAPKVSTPASVATPKVVSPAMTAPAAAKAVEAAPVTAMTPEVKKDIAVKRDIKKAGVKRFKASDKLRLNMLVQQTFSQLKQTSLVPVLKNVSVDRRVNLFVDGKSFTGKFVGKGVVTDVVGNAAMGTAIGKVFEQGKMPVEKSAYFVVRFGTGAMADAPAPEGGGESRDHKLQIVVVEDKNGNPQVNSCLYNSKGSFVAGTPGCFEGSYKADATTSLDVTKEEGLNIVQQDSSEHFNGEVLEGTAAEDEKPQATGYAGVINDSDGDTEDETDDISNPPGDDSDDDMDDDMDDYYDGDTDGDDDDDDFQTESGHGGGRGGKAGLWVSLGVDDASGRERAGFFTEGGSGHGGGVTPVEMGGALLSKTGMASSASPDGNVLGGPGRTPWAGMGVNVWSCPQTSVGTVKTSGSASFGDQLHGGEGVCPGGGDPLPMIMVR